MTKYLNTPYWREIKELLKDYMSKLNLEYIVYGDIKHIVSRSEFTRLCKTGFFVRYHLHGNHCNANWSICESERPTYSSTILNFKR